MDRLQFINKTYDGQILLNDIISFFDHTMVAYDILEQIKALPMCSQPDNSHSLLKIKLYDLSEPDMVHLGALINEQLHNYIELYDRAFNIYLIDNEYELNIQRIK